MAKDDDRSIPEVFAVERYQGLPEGYAPYNSLKKGSSPQLKVQLGLIYARTPLRIILQRRLPAHGPIAGPPRWNYQPTHPGSLKASLMSDTSGSGQLP